MSKSVEILLEQNAGLSIVLVVSEGIIEEIDISQPLLVILECKRGAELSVQLEFYVPADFRIPKELLIRDNVSGQYRFRSKDQLAGDVDSEQEAITGEQWQALRKRMQVALSSPFEIQSGAGGQQVLGLATIGGSALGAVSLEINPAIISGFGQLPDNAWVARLRASAALQLSLASTVDTQLSQSSIGGIWRLVVTISKAAIDQCMEAWLDLDIPNLPGFNLALPLIKLPNLSFSGLSLQLNELGERFSCFDLAIPMLKDLQFVKYNGFTVAIGASDANLSVKISTPGEPGSINGKFLFKAGATDQQTLCAISDFKLSYDSGQKKSALSFSVTELGSIKSKWKYDATGDKAPDWMPFFVVFEVESTIAVSKLDLSVGDGTATVASIQVKHSLPKIEIISREEPSLFLNLWIEFEATLTSNGSVTTRLTKLEVIEPYSFDLLAAVVDRAVEAAGRLIRLIAAIPLPSVGGAPVTPDLARLLARLVELIASAIRWLTRQAAGLAEAAAKLVATLLDRLTDLATGLFNAITIEVRLDPRTYQLRQILIAPVGTPAIGAITSGSALGFDLDFKASARPSLLFDVGPEGWVGIVLQPDADSGARLATDLWLDRETGPQEPMGTLSPADGSASGPNSRLIEITARPGQSMGAKNARDIVLVALQGGRLRTFQTFGPEPLQPDSRDESPTLSLQQGNITVRSFHALGRLRPARASFLQDDSGEVVVSARTDFPELKQRLLGLLPKGEPLGEPGGQGSFVDQLKQRVEITEAGFSAARLEMTLGVKVIVSEGFVPEAKLVAKVNLNDLSVKLTGGDRIAIRAPRSGPPREYNPLGLSLVVSPKEGGREDSYEQFVIDLAHGGERMSLGKEAIATLSFNQVSSSGKGLQFEIDELGIGRGGIDLSARVKPEPVRLGGINMPFRFQTGGISIAGSRFTGGSLQGVGQLPDTLLGETNASIALTLGRRDNADDVAVLAAHAVLDKSGDPIRCHATRFDITITDLGMGMVYEGGYHFYFKISGSARFNPDGSEFASGLLKNVRGVEIEFEKAPLAKDPRVLMRHISFQTKLKPPKQLTLFDIFRFELRSIAFYPATPKFDGRPAVGLGGQVNFGESGDRVSAKIDFHEMLIGAPLPGQFLPQVRFDGLSVAISVPGIKISGTALTVDGDIPGLLPPGEEQRRITAKGFMASGQIEIEGWAPMSASVGFMELRSSEAPTRKPRHAFFFYGQQAKLSTPIDTPIGTIYLREFGFGLGFRFTLAGLALADRATGPNGLVATFDAISRSQGNLDKFEAWQPEYDTSNVTLALRGMLAMSAAQRDSNSYNERVEETLPNPLLFDIVAALRSDMTFLINLRGWLNVNYHDWFTSNGGDGWKSNPTFRGYLYFSVPRREFLGRFLSDGSGHIGNRPQLPEPLKDAIRASRFSSTLYIRPGLFHFELGWPYEIGFDLGRPSDDLYLSLRAGLVQRVEDSAVLMGLAFKAKGGVRLGGRVGSRRFGAEVSASAQFELEGRALSYLSLSEFNRSFYYGALRIDMTIQFRIGAWLVLGSGPFKVSLSIGFCASFTIALAIEAVISPDGLGGRAVASICVRVFGRSTVLGVGFAFNQGNLGQARARVARFMELGLAAQIPSAAEPGQPIQTNPQPEPPRRESASAGDAALGGVPAELPEPQDDDQPGSFVGDDIRASNFWAILFPTRSIGGKETYIMQLVPRDHTLLTTTDAGTQGVSSFFASCSKTQAGWSASHTLQHVEALSGATMRQFDPNDVTSINNVAFGSPLHVNTVTTVRADTASIELSALINSLFLCETDANGVPIKLTEPRPRPTQLIDTPLPRDQQSSANELARCGRSRISLDPLSNREAEIEESRSAILGAIVESAALLAELGPNGEVWPQQATGMDARSMGLTFVVSRDDLKELFPGVEGENVSPPAARFTVEKSDAPGSQGTVHLFNPPNRMFRELQPSFRPVQVPSDQGVVLDWDLEPGWGQSLGAYHDPEFHLRHYRIRRRVIGLPDQRDFAATFEVRAAGLCEYTEDSRIVRIRPPYQFIDDFRLTGSDRSPGAEVPSALRDALLGRADTRALQDAGFRDAESWIEDVLVEYEIIPVDTAGTADFGEVWVHRPGGIPPKVPPAPQAVTLRLDFPKAGSQPFSDPAKLQLVLSCATKPPMGTVFGLRILAEPIMALGAYGVDALEEAGRNFDERAIDRLSGNDVTDFKLTLTKSTSGAGLVPVTIELPNREIIACSASLGSSEAANSLRRALGLSDPDDRPGTRRRAFLRQLANPPSGVALNSLWRTAMFNIVAVREQEVLINAMLDTFERPRVIAFEALTKESGGLRAESGRVHILHPASDSTLKGLLQSEDPCLVNLPDPARRTGTRLAWKLEAAGLKSNRASDNGNHLPRWLGGYQLFMVDPDTIPARNEAWKVTDLADYAAYLGKVTLLPRSFDGLEPSSFGDFSRLASAFPTDTLRLPQPSSSLVDPKSKPDSTLNAGWYSPAESLPVLPRPSIRRLLMPEPDEVMIASLFEHGPPKTIRISLKDWLTDWPDNDPLRNWKLIAVGIAREKQGIREKKLEIKIDQRHPVAHVRSILKSLALVPHLDGADTDERNLLRQRLKDPGYLAAVTILVEVVGVNGANRREPSLETIVDLMPQRHPILLDTLARLAYAPLSAGKGEGDGQVYRRYSVLVDPPPPTTATSFVGWLDESPPERDPYGWAALRTLGLAEGFRIYDKDTGEYLRGEALLAHINRTFQTVLELYDDDEKRFNGQPFVDILTKPWGNASLAWFDGASQDPTSSDTAELLHTRMLATVQLALRPAPDGHAEVVRDIPAPLVRYYAVKLAAGSGGWSVTQRTDDSKIIAAIDLLPLVGGLEDNQPVRLKVGGTVQFRSPGGNGTVAVVRVLVSPGAMPDALVKELNELLEIARVDAAPSTGNPSENAAEVHFVALPRPAIEASAGQEIAFGRFNALPASEWAELIWGKPADPVTSVSESYSRLDYYTGRRFERLVIAGGSGSDRTGLSPEEVAGAFVRFGTRFLEYGAPARAGSRTIYFSFGTVADPGEWRIAPDGSGELSVFLPDLERRGARRKFAIQPYGRYDTWMAAGRGAQNKVPVPELILNEADGLSQFVDCTLHRTEPLAKPVVLSAIRRPPNAFADDQIKHDENDLSRVELVVAHENDRVLAQANIKNEALLAPIDLSLTIKRTFQHTGWLAGLAAHAGGSNDLGNPLGKFGSSSRADSFKFPVLSEDLSQKRLVELRKLVPDAWLGSEMLSVAAPPYFFDVRAFVSVAAGIDVSEETEVSLPEGSWKQVRPSQADEGYSHRAIAGPPVWRVVDSGFANRLHGCAAPVIQLDLPLTRFIDCMHTHEAATWFGAEGKGFGDVRKVAHLPEPTVSYAVFTEARNETSEVTIARTREFDLLPTVPAADCKHPQAYFLVQSSSQVWRQQSADMKLAPTVDSSEQCEWRIRLAIMPSEHVTVLPIPLQYFAARLDSILTGSDQISGVDVVQAYQIKVTALADNWGEMHKAAMEALGASPEARSALAAWEQQTPVGEALTLQVARRSVSQHKALEALADLTGASATATGDPQLWLRWLPTAAAIREFAPEANEAYPDLAMDGYLALCAQVDRLARSQPGAPIKADRYLTPKEAEVWHKALKVLSAEKLKGITSLRQCTLTYSHVSQPNNTEWTKLVQAAMVEASMNPEALAALATWREQPQSGASLRLPLDHFSAQAGSAAYTALEELAGATPELADDELIYLARAPDDAALAALKDELTRQDGGDALWQSVLALAQVQVLGANRYWRLGASKSGSPPVRQDILRALEGHDNG